MATWRRVSDGFMKSTSKRTEQKIHSDL